MEKNKEREQRQGHRTMSRCFESKTLRNDLDIGPGLRWISGQQSGFRRGRIQLAGFEKALLQPPNKSLVLIPKWICFPDFNKVSLGGLALRCVVMIQNT